MLEFWASLETKFIRKTCILQAETGEWPNSVEKMVHQKKNMGHRMSKIVKSRQSYINGLLAYYCSFYYLARAGCMTWHVNLRAQ